MSVCRLNPTRSQQSSCEGNESGELLKMSLAFKVSSCCLLLCVKSNTSILIDQCCDAQNSIRNVLMQTTFVVAHIFIYAIAAIRSKLFKLFKCFQSINSPVCKILPINQSINQLINQSINQSINQPTNNQSANRSI